MQFYGRNWNSYHCINFLSSAKCGGQIGGEKTQQITYWWSESWTLLIQVAAKGVAGRRGSALLIMWSCQCGACLEVSVTGSWFTTADTGKHWFPFSLLIILSTYISDLIIEIFFLSVMITDSKYHPGKMWILKVDCQNHIDCYLCCFWLLSPGTLVASHSHFVPT